jgi:hypothetical protein
MVRMNGQRTSIRQERPSGTILGRVAEDGKPVPQLASPPQSEGFDWQGEPGQL